MPFKRKNKRELTPPSDFLEQPVELSGMENPVRATADLSHTPTRVGPYLLLERLGAGGMAEVYLARKQGVNGFEKDVALKCVLPRHLGNDDIHVWLEREAKLGSRLNHANIAQIHDFIRVGNSYWMVMEYIRGKSLEEVNRKARSRKLAIAPTIATYLICQVLAALEHAHHRSDDRSGEGSPVIHRDIKAKNVMVSYWGEVKVVDFGIAKPLFENDSGITGMGRVKGTPGYMSPEQMRAELLDIRTDLYSTCVLFYELLAGKALFPGGSMEMSQAKHERRVTQRVNALKVSNCVRKALVKGLAWDKAKRFGSALELRQVLEKEFQGQAPFSQDAVTTLVFKLFEKEMEEEKKAAESREARLEAWRARGLPTPEGDFGYAFTSVPSWKRSPLILTLLVITVITTFLNLWLSIMPEGLWGTRLKWRYRSPASHAGCFVTVESVPGGANLSANSVYLGKTPTTFRARCGERFKLQLESEGYKLLETELSATQQSHQLLLQMSRH